MPFLSRLAQGLVAVASVAFLSNAFAASDSIKSSQSSKATALRLGEIDYVHRWSKDGQNEFTPERDSDLARWHDMVTINVHKAVANADQLADLANRVLGNYQSHGKIVRTDSKPRTPQRPAEHLIVAILGNPKFLEAAFARVVLVDGVGFVAVYSHRVYGESVGNAMSDWLKSNGQSVEKTLMTWDKIPSLATLKELPQSK